MNKITVAGSGVLGSQIAFQTAYHGYAVALYDISDAVLEKARATLTSLGKHYETDIGATQSDINAAMERITMTTDLGTALILGSFRTPFSAESRLTNRAC